jgi:hypothetical protein
MYNTVYEILRNKIILIKNELPIKYLHLIKYSKPLLFPNQIITILSKQILNTYKDLNWILKQKPGRFFNFLKNVICISKNRLHSRGSPALLIQVLRFTAQDVQKSLDHKKQQNTSYKICKYKENIYDKNGNNDLVAKVVFNTPPNLYLWKFDKHNIKLIQNKSTTIGEIYETKKNSNMYNLLSKLIVSNSCIGMEYVNKNSSRSLLTYTSTRYLNYNLKKYKCKLGTHCYNSDFSHFFTQHIQPLYADSIFPKLPYSRVGIRNNFRRSSLSKICFEASKSNYLKQALLKLNIQNQNDLCGALAFGNPIPFGTGYNISIHDTF